MLGDMLWEHEIYAGSIYDQKGLVITQDIDSDGYDDVVVGSSWGGRLIRTISGKTGGTIWTHDTHEYGDGGWVYQVDSQFDYNNDGVKDVLAATGDDSTGTGPKRVYCLDGLTGTSIWERPLTGPVFSVIGIEDCTGDGQPDAVAGAADASETTGYVYGINGATGALFWTFTAATGTYGGVWAIEQIDDISSDGIKDVIAADFYTAAGTVYGLDATTGTDEWSNNLGQVMITRFEKIEDVNNDGHPDILPACLDTTLVRVIDGQNGNIIWSHSVLDQPSTVVQTSDINGDGIKDLAVGTVYTNNYCYWLDGTDGTELQSLNLGNPIDAITSIPDVVGDVNSTWEVITGDRYGAITCLSGGGDIPDPLQEKNITLYTGWNLITVPLDNPWTAETLGENISGCTTVCWFNASSQSYVTHVVGIPYNDFSLVDGVGYFVYVAGGSYLNVTGLFIDSVNVTLYTQWNLIGWYKETATIASSLGAVLDGCTTICMFDAVVGSYVTHVVGIPYNDFSITSGMGLFISNDTSGWWHGQG
jgi:outer membrane protein assembly factor BamB